MPPLNFTKVEIRIRKELEGEQETAFLVDYWHPGLNRVPAISLRAQSDEKVFLYRICKQHVCFKVARYVVNSFKRDACSALDCKVCKFYNGQGKSRADSDLEHAVFDMIGSMMAADAWITDCYLPGMHQYSSSTADVWILEPGLVIMIDGGQHFHDGWAIKAADQEKIDWTFNAAAVRLGMCVLRLHFKDVAGCFPLIQFALTAAKYEGAAAFPMFSKSFSAKHRHGHETIVLP